MKTLSIVLLAASLVLNATFVSLYVGGRKAAEIPLDTPATSAGSKAAGPTNPALAEAWRSLDAEHLPDLVTRLRASGFPPEVVRAVIAAQVRESFAARRKALAADYERGPWWQNYIRDPKTQMALRALDRDEQKTVRELLGKDGESDDPMMRYQRERGLEFLPAAKADEVRQLVRDFEERRADLYAAGFNYLTDQSKMTALEKEQRAAIARTLSPEEHFEYSVRQSQTADRLRQELTAFKPTEDEYRALFRMRAAFDEEFGDYVPGMTQAEMTRRFEAERRLKDQMKSVLTPARAADYDKLTDSNYRRTTQLIARLELPPNTTDQLFAVQKEFEQRRNDLYRNARTPVEREQVTEQLRDLQQEALAKVTPMLGGARAVEAYRQHGGTWISSLIPRPAHTRATAPTPAAKK